MQCNYNSFILIINFHGLFRNALRCRKTGACRILVPLQYNAFVLVWNRAFKALPSSIISKPLSPTFIGGGGGHVPLVLPPPPQISINSKWGLSLNHDDLAHIVKIKILWLLCVICDLSDKFWQVQIELSFVYTCVDHWRTHTACCQRLPLTYCCITVNLSI